MTKLEITEQERELIKALTDNDAEQHLALYKKSGNGVLIWKIYKTYRSARLPVPDYILKKLDDYAENIICGQDAFVALELKKADAKGGAQGVTANVKTERERDIVLRNHLLRRHFKPMEAARKTAEEFGTSVAHVKGLYTKWTKQEKRPNSLLFDVLCRGK